MCCQENRIRATIATSELKTVAADTAVTNVLTLFSLLTKRKTLRSGPGTYRAREDHKVSGTEFQ